MQEDEGLTQGHFSWCFPDVTLLGRAKWMGRGLGWGRNKAKGWGEAVPDTESASALGSSGGGEEGVGEEGRRVLQALGSGSRLYITIKACLCGTSLHRTLGTPPRVSCRQVGDMGQHSSDASVGNLGRHKSS